MYKSLIIINKYCDAQRVYNYVLCKFLNVCWIPSSSKNLLVLVGIVPLGPNF